MQVYDKERLLCKMFSHEIASLSINSAFSPKKWSSSEMRKNYSTIWTVSLKNFRFNFNSLKEDWKFVFLQL